MEQIPVDTEIPEKYREVYEAVLAASLLQENGTGTTGRLITCQEALSGGLLGVLEQTPHREQYVGRTQWNKQDIICGSAIRSGN